MENKQKLGFATRQIHVGKIKDASGALCTPIYQTSTFEFETVQQGGARFAGEEPGYIYSRLSNPSLTQAEEKLASLENGEAALAAASGMGAISAALWTSVVAGDEILASDTLYGCTFSLLCHGMTRFGVDTKFIDMVNLENFQEHLTPKTKVVYFETPCNPTLKILDIQAIAEAAHKYNPSIRVIVDNTFCSPYLQRPLELGADVVVHSATKYINGHGDVIAGFIVGTAEFIGQCRTFGLKDMTGAVMSPFDAFLIARGLKTLDIRMERHCSNARKVAEFLHSHPAVDKVYYPGLPDFKGSEVAQKQMKDFGGMLSIELKASREEVANALNNLGLCSIAVSLGDAETLVEHAATMTHSTYTPEELAAAGISEGLVRISVGLEDPDDIIADLKSVLDTLVS
ncbi:MULTISPECIES: methionine gamma-lyase [unclassified Oscillibacter]|uniref:methionine gamma-lyase n=1 Tax=unclassified Oscillibacter TaxID=2629304 RepID=UPI0025EF6A8D|nr:MULTISPECIES: methionine gamma-lyase [unclassified Oscillibacter]